MSLTDMEIGIWEQAAPQWARHAERIAGLTAPATAGLLRRLQPAPGSRLLDLAAGTGDPALRLAELVGPAGHVLATDGSAAMLATLARRAQERGLPQLELRACAAERLDLPAASFDGACSRFGVMFFGEPELALGRVHGALRRAGRLVLVAWGARELNPFFTAATEVLDGLGTPEVATPGQRTVFEYAEPGKLAQLVAGAGFRDVSEERERARLELPGTAPEELLDVLVDMSRRVADRVGALDAARREQARRRLAERVAPLAGGGALHFPAEILYLTATA